MGALSLEEPDCRTSHVPSPKSIAALHWLPMTGSSIHSSHLKKEQSSLWISFPPENPKNFYLVHRQQNQAAPPNFVAAWVVFLLPRHPSCITTFVDANFQIFRRLLIGILQLRSKDLRCDLLQRSDKGYDLNRISHRYNRGLTKSLTKLTY